jgi:hypothetical protein
MAAPLGFKTFTTGEVLTAADTNGYLMQGVLVFASAAARTSAISSPQEGQVSYLKDTDVVQIYNGSSWVTSGGLALIATSTFTTASSVIFDSVFSSSYNNYLLTFNITAATATAYVNCVFRTGGSDISTAVYGFSGGTASTSSGAVTNEIASATQGGSLISRTNTGGNGYASGSINIYNPFASTYTFADSMSIAATGTTGAFSNYRISTAFTGTNSFDGFKFNPGSGTITGTAKVYGLQN